METVIGTQIYWIYSAKLNQSFAGTKSCDWTAVKDCYQKELNYIYFEIENSEQSFIWKHLKSSFIHYMLLLHCKDFVLQLSRLQYFFNFFVVHHCFKPPFNAFGYKLPSVHAFSWYQESTNIATPHVTVNININIDLYTNRQRNI